MKWNWIKLLFGIIFGTTLLSAQDPCLDYNFQDSIYTWKVDTSVFFAAKDNNRGGVLDSLKMDIFYPENEIDNRPLVMIAYGGAFVQGSKDSMAFLAERFAARGYVAVTFDYRLYHIGWGLFPPVTIFQNIALNAMDDMADATNAVLEKAEQYRINPNAVVLSGASAGAIMSLHLGFVDSTDTFESNFEARFKERSAFWGFDRSKVIGIINLSGAVLDTSFINNDIPTISYHGDMDETVPYEEGLANGILFLQGSKLIHEKLDNIGVENTLVTVQGGGHTNIYYDPLYAPQLKAFEVELVHFLNEILCPVMTSTQLQKEEAMVQIYPNPTSGRFTLAMEDPSQISQLLLLNNYGQKIWSSSKITEGQLDFNIEGNSGMYHLMALNKSGATLFTKTLIKQ